MKIWINKVWCARPGGLSKKIVLDSFSGHLTDHVKRQLQQQNTEMAVIPGGLTSVTQPLDVCVNKPFKDKLREKWNSWMINETSSSPVGNIKRASLPTVSQWVVETWRGIKPESVSYSVKKCGISNRLDSTEDDILWEEIDEQSTELEEEMEENDIMMTM